MEDKKNKPVYKKWWFWLVAFLVFGFVVGQTADDEPKEDVEEEAKEETKEESKEKDEEEKPKEDKEEKKETEDKEEEKKEKEKSEKIKETDFYDGELTMVYEPGTLWDENSFFRIVYDSFADVKDAFEDDEVDSVVVMINALMTDEKGNEDMKPVITYRYTREGFDELNYEKFYDMAMVEEWRILNESESYFINPGIRNKLKDKYTENLR